MPRRPSRMSTSTTSPRRRFRIWATRSLMTSPEGGRRTGAIVQIEHAGEVHVLGLADDGDLPRQMPVAQAHGD